MNIKELLIQALLPTIEALGESKLAGAIVQVKEKDPDHFQEDLQAFYNFVKRIDVFSKQSKTPFDDMATQTIMQAILDAAMTTNTIIVA